jgi:hypothetical protein
MIAQPLQSSCVSRKQNFGLCMETLASFFEVPDASTADSVRFLCNLAYLGAIDPVKNADFPASSGRKAVPRDWDTILSGVPDELVTYKPSEIAAWFCKKKITVPATAREISRTLHEQRMMKHGRRQQESRPWEHIDFGPRDSKTFYHVHLA